MPGNGDGIADTSLALLHDDGFHFSITCLTHALSSSLKGGSTSRP
jgi:hypothetical protein